jgi:multiple sugar transport system permease protein
MDSGIATVKIRLLRQEKRKQNLIGWALLTPYILLLLFFGVLPIVMGVVISFTKYNPLDPSYTEFIGFENYKTLFTFSSLVSKQFWRAFGATLLFDAIAIPCLIIIPLILAYLIHLHPPGYKIFRAIIYLPSVISITIVGILFSGIFKDNSDGLFNALFKTNIIFMNGELFKGDQLRWMVMILASVWWQTGTNFVIFLGALRDVPGSLYEACEMDGGGRWVSMLKVTLPNIRSSIAICLFNTLIGYLGLYGQPTVINGDLNKTTYFSPMQMIQGYLTGSSAYMRRTGFICAVAVVFGLIVVLFTVVERTIMKERRKPNRFSRQYTEYLNANEGGNIDA